MAAACKTTYGRRPWVKGKKKWEGGYTGNTEGNGEVENDRCPWHLLDAGGRKMSKTQEVRVRGRFIYDTGERPV